MGILKNVIPGKGVGIFLKVRIPWKEWVSFTNIRTPGKWVGSLSRMWKYLLKEGAFLKMQEYIVAF